MHPDKPVGVWGQDEARVGLKPILCKVWALKRQRPLALHRTREWLYVYLFVHPASGRSTFLILPTVNSGPMRLALREFQQERGAEGSAAALTALHPKALPGRAREAVANEGFPSLEALQERLAERCVYLQEQPEVIRGAAGFGWIPEEWLSI